MISEVATLRPWTQVVCRSQTVALAASQKLLSIKRRKLIKNIINKLNRENKRATLETEQPKSKEPWGPDLFGSLDY